MAQQMLQVITNLLNFGQIISIVLGQVIILIPTNYRKQKCLVMMKGNYFRLKNIFFIVTIE